MSNILSSEKTYPPPPILRPVRLEWGKMGILEFFWDNLGRNCCRHSKLYCINHLFAGNADIDIWMFLSQNRLKSL